MTPPSAAQERRNAVQGPRSRLVVGLVNNMSDGALRATEAQFCGLLAEAAPASLELDVRFYSLSEIQRGDEALAHMRGRYSPIDRVQADGVDALIVTGAEPRAATFEEEPYWSSLARLIDWAAHDEVPTVWSCLAAHAAVWRLHRAPRRRFAVKLSGVFGLQPAPDAAGGAPAPAFAPHSRWNDLDPRDIQSAGYDILARSPEAGVDSFVRNGRTTSIFFQGHPEYDAGALGREYVRDVSRFLRGQLASPPRPPTGYFDPQADATLADLTQQLARAPDAELLRRCAQIAESRTPSAAWRPWALHAYRLWLRQFTVQPPAEQPPGASVPGQSAATTAP